jgi:hypothetical protein
MGQTLAAFAKQAAQALIVELIVPGGTLILLSILLARRFPAISGELSASLHDFR